MRDNEGVSTEIETEHARPPRARRPPRRMGVLVLVAAIVLTLDIVSKAVVVATLEGDPPLKLLGGAVYFFVIRNPGAAFGIGTDMTWLFSVVMIIVALAVVVFARRVRSVGWAIGLGMVLAGALGNLIDRIFRAPAPFQGWVVDFISLFAPKGGDFAIFNVADSGITLGVALIVVLSVLGRDFDGNRAHWRKRPATETKTGEDGA